MSVSLDSSCTQPLFPEPPTTVTQPCPPCPCCPDARSQSPGLATVPCPAGPCCPSQSALGGFSSPGTRPNPVRAADSLAAFAHTSLRVSSVTPSWTESLPCRAPSAWRVPRCGPSAGKRREGRVGCEAARRSTAPRRSGHACPRVCVRETGSGTSRVAFPGVIIF